MGNKFNSEFNFYFISLLQESYWDTFLEESTDAIYAMFIQKFSEIYNEVFLKYTAQYQYDNRKPLLTH